MSLFRRPILALTGSVLLATSVASTARAKDVSLLKVSYDPTREFYREYNENFAKYWQETTVETVTVRRSQEGADSLPGPSSTGWMPMLPRWRWPIYCPMRSNFRPETEQSLSH